MASTPIVGMTRSRYTKTRYLAPDGSTVPIFGSVTNARNAWSEWYSDIGLTLRAAMNTVVLLNGLDGVRRIRGAGMGASTAWAKRCDDGVWRVIDAPSCSVSCLNTYQLQETVPELRPYLTQPVFPMADVARIIRERVDSEALVILLHVPYGEHRVSHHRVVSTPGGEDLSVPLVQIKATNSGGYALTDDNHRINAVEGADTAVLAYALDNVVLIGMDAGPAVFSSSDTPPTPVALAAVRSDVRDAITTYGKYIFQERIAKIGHDRDRCDVPPAVVASRLAPGMSEALDRTKHDMIARREELLAQLRRVTLNLASNSCAISEIEHIEPNLEKYVAEFATRLGECDSDHFRGIAMRTTAPSSRSDNMRPMMVVDAGDVEIEIAQPDGAEPTRMAMSVSLPINCEVIRQSEAHTEVVGLSCLPTYTAELGSDRHMSVNIPHDERSLALAHRWLIDPAAALKVYINAARQAVEQHLRQNPPTLS